MEAQEIAAAVGHIPSGLFVVTTKSPEGIEGYLASWVQQVSFNPLMISLAINPDRPGYETIKKGGVFTVNIVGDHSANYLKHFWSGFDHANNPFTKGEIGHQITEDGAVIIEDAKSTIECEFVSSTNPGDHEILVARVIQSHIQNDEAKPKVHIRKSGLDY